MTKDRYVVEVKVKHRPVDYIPRTRELYATHEPYRWVESNTPPPFVGIDDDLAKATVLLVSSSGMFIGGEQEPFSLSDDSSIREIPSDVDARYLWPAHFGYKTARAEADPNTVFPLERLREMSADGAIGEIASHAITFMGGIYSHRRGGEELTPAVVESAQRTEANLALLVPV